MSGVVALIASQAQHIRVETTAESFLDEDHPARIIYTDFRHEFGRDEKTFITVTPKDLFSFKFLNTLKQLHKELEGAPHAVEVTSLINTRQTIGENDQLIVGELMEDWPTNEEELAQLREKVMSNPIYQGMLISEDGTETNITIETETYSSLATEEEDALTGFEDNTIEAEEPPFLTGEENSEFVLAVESIVAKYNSPDLLIHVAGTPSISHRIMKVMSDDIAKFTGLSLLCIAVFLALMFRRISAIFLPLLVAMLSLLCTVGTMALLGIPFTPIGQSMPSFLLAVGVGNSVHLLAIFHQGIQKGMNKKDALSNALGHSGLPIMMTGVTTAGGILSFTTADISHVVDFGIITTIGVLNALLFSLLMLPALISVFPVKLNIDTHQRDTKTTWISHILIWCGRFSTHHAGKVVTVYSLLLVASLISASNIQFSHDPIRWFKTDDPMRIATEYADAHFSGAMTLEVVVDTKKENGVKDPEILRRIDKMHHAVNETQVDGVRAKKAISIVDINKEIHKALNENNPEYYTIPQSQALASQELLLFENSGADDLVQRLIDSSLVIGNSKRYK